MAVLASATAQITRHLREDVEATIDVGHWEESPRTWRNDDGPTSYTIRLAAGSYPPGQNTGSHGSGANVPHSGTRLLR